MQLSRSHCAFVCGMFYASFAFGQAGGAGGNIQGTVKDSTGASIPGAKLSIRSLEQGIVTNTVTNPEGYFSTPTLTIGEYKVRVEFTGMKAWEGQILLETGKTVELSPVLQPGQVSETITVTEASPLVTTTDPTDGSTLDAKRIQELPVNGRDLNTLLSDVTPGMEQVIDVNGGVRTAGLMVYSTNYVQDGAASNNREFGGSMNLQGLESIGEVRVETSTSSARYSSPASVIVTTKGGSNRFRGAVYETARNNAFGVAKARQDVNYNGVPYAVPKLIRNEFGGSLGGPVYLPSFGLNGKKLYNGHNRTFFFVSREAVELRQGLTREWTVPTVAMRNGDFSGLIDSQGRKIIIYDPLTTSSIRTSSGREVTTRLPFPGNMIPGNRQSELSKRIWGITPLPTDITNPLVTNNLKMTVATNGYPNLSDSPTTARLDHRFNERDTIFVKFNGGRRTANFLGTASNNGAPTTNMEANVTFLPMEAISGTLNWTHIFTPSLFVESSFNRTAQSTKTVTGPDQRDWAKELGLPNPKGEIGWPNITNVQFMNYVEGDNRRSLRSLVDNIEQNFTLIKRTHNLQFGWRYHRERQTLLPDQGAISGSAYFNSNATAVESQTSGTPTNPAVAPQTGSDAANFYLGIGARYDIGLKRSYMHVLDRNAGFYLQDNYKVSGRLTLTPGIRWDINPSFVDADHVLNAFDVKSHSLLLPESLDYYYKIGATTPAVLAQYKAVDLTFKTAEELGVSKNIFQSNYVDIGPRLGFAYRALEGKAQFVIRGGYGLYISPMPMRTLLAQFSGEPPFRGTFKYDPNSAAQSPDRISNYLLRNVPTVIAGVDTANIVDFSTPDSIGRGLSVLGIGPLPSMQIHEWNLALERQIGHTTVFRIRYNGKHGIHADQLNNINPTQTNYVWYSRTGLPLPSGTFSAVARRPYDQVAYTDVRILEKTGFINTSTFTLELERRFSKGIGFQLFHTTTNASRAAGNSFRDHIGSVPEAYIPGSVPTDPAELNRFLNYSRDTSIPKHRTRWNWNYDLPFGRGKWLAHNAHGVLQNLIGGWKFSGTGTIVSSWFALPTGNWGEMGNFEVYGQGRRILDCRSTPATGTKASEERCFEGYQYFNGYISERFINSRNAAGLRNGVFGLPDDYRPAQKPVHPWPKGGQPNDPGSADWDTNVVYIKLQNGNTVRETADTGLHPWRQQYRLGPFNWTNDASLLKFFSVKENVRLRMNVDVFNVFNVQGLNTPGSDGIVTLQNSYGGFGIRPRQMQVNLRLEW